VVVPGREPWRGAQALHLAAEQGGRPAWTVVVLGLIEGELDGRRARVERQDAPWHDRGSLPGGHSLGGELGRVSQVDASGGAGATRSGGAGGPRQLRTPVTIVRSVARFRRRIRSRKWRSPGRTCPAAELAVTGAPRSISACSGGVQERAGEDQDR